jgi:hypothetical protein
MPAKPKLPNEAELQAVLGSAAGLWSDIINAIEAQFDPLDKECKPSKAAFGLMCLLRHRKRTLLYITPDKEKVWIAIVLGERAYGLATKSSLPAKIKKMLAEAKPYAEGRGIRFAVTSSRDIPVITKLVEIKTAPK